MGASVCKEDTGAPWCKELTWTPRTPEKTLQKTGPTLLGSKHWSRQESKQRPGKGLPDIEEETCRSGVEGAVSVKFDQKPPDIEKAMMVDVPVTEGGLEVPTARVDHDEAALVDQTRLGADEVVLDSCRATPASEGLLLMKLDGAPAYPSAKHADLSLALRPLSCDTNGTLDAAFAVDWKQGTYRHRLRAWF